MILSIFMLLGSLSLFADTVTIKKDKTLLENVKTSVLNKQETVVEFKDGTKQTFKTATITVTQSPVVWEETPKEKPGFFSQLFASKSQEKESTQSETLGSEEPKKEEGFFSKRLPELTMGGMALLWVLLP
ncbi:hypothetical protein P3G55_11565 [Leptospira sp. 96542]|nr:hypothetical protein [Leptospira sp. 96542]